MQLSPLYIDIAVGIVLLLSALPAFFSGLLRELLRLVDILIAVIGGLLLYQYAQPLIETHIMVLDSSFKRVIGLVGCGVVAFIVAVIITSIVSRMLTALHGTFLNRILGLAFGVLRGVIVIAIIYLGYERFYRGDDAASCPRVASTEDQAGSLSSAIETAKTAQLYCPIANYLLQAAPESWDSVSGTAKQILMPIIELVDPSAAEDMADRSAAINAIEQLQSAAESEIAQDALEVDSENIAE